VAGSYAIATGTAQLVPDRDSDRRWTLNVNGVPSSWIDLDNPADLGFEYLDTMRTMLDDHLPPPHRVDAVHLGGAGCTFARALAAARPRSRQLVAEIDPDLVELARGSFGLSAVPGLRLRAVDGLSLLAATRDGSADLVVRDAFAGEAVPGELTTAGFLAEVTRVLAPDGLYLANVADRPPLRLARAEVATALCAFAEVALVAEPGVLRGRRYANLVLAASAGTLPLDRWGRSVRGGAVPMRLVAGDDLTAFAAASTPIR